MGVLFLGGMFFLVILQIVSCGLTGIGDRDDGCDAENIPGLFAGDNLINPHARNRHLSWSVLISREISAAFVAADRAIIGGA